MFSVCALGQLRRALSWLCLKWKPTGPPRCRCSTRPTSTLGQPDICMYIHVNVMWRYLHIYPTPNNANVVNVGEHTAGCVRDGGQRCHRDAAAQPVQRLPERRARLLQPAVGRAVATCRAWGHSPKVASWMQPHYERRCGKEMYMCGCVYIQSKRGEGGRRGSEGARERVRERGAGREGEEGEREIQRKKDR